MLIILPISYSNNIRITGKIIMLRNIAYYLTRTAYYSIIIHQNFANNE